MPSKFPRLVAALEGYKSEIGAFDFAVERCRNAKLDNRHIFFAGNGGSAAIASHMSEDFLKAGQFRAHNFNDAAQITCLANDLGYESVFSYPLALLADADDVLIAISSSGASANILKAVEVAREKGMAVITLSGFKADNPLRGKGDLNFYVPSDSYGIVEVAHLAILHSILDRCVEDM